MGRIHPIPTISQAVMLWWGCHYSPRLSPWSPPELQSNLGFESVSLQVFLYVYILWISPIYICVSIYFKSLYIYIHMYTFKYIHTLFPTYIYLYQHSWWSHRPVSAPAEPVGPVEPVVPVELVDSTAAAWPRPEPSGWTEARGRELEQFVAYLK